MHLADISWGFFLVAWLPYLIFGGGVLYLGAKFVRAFERRSATRAELASMQDRLLKLEEGVADIASSVDRLAEGQSFTTRVLAGRSEATVPELGAGVPSRTDATTG